MEETSLEDSHHGQSQSLMPAANPASTSKAKVMTQEEARLYFKERRDKRENSNRTKAERKKKFDSKIHVFYQSLPMKICTFLAFLVANVLHIGEIIVGILFIKDEDCPADKIALVMILLGVVGTLLATTHLYEMWSEMRRKKLEQAAEKASESDPAPAGESSEEPTQAVKSKWKLSPKLCVSILLQIADLCIFLYACLIVFRLYNYVQYEKVENSTISSEFYCNKVLYRYALWSLASTFIFLGIVLAFACAIGCFEAWYVYMKRSVSGLNISVA